MTSATGWWCSASSSGRARHAPTCASQRGNRPSEYPVAHCATGFLCPGRSRLPALVRRRLAALPRGGITGLKLRGALSSVDPWVYTGGEYRPLQRERSMAHGEHQQHHAPGPAVTSHEAPPTGSVRGSHATHNKHAAQQARRARSGRLSAPVLGRPAADGSGRRVERRGPDVARLHGSNLRRL